MPFNHFDDRGRAVMVDVGGKEPTRRTAVAQARVALRPEVLDAVLEGRMTKGDVFGVARVAGIAAAKKTQELIPLSHPVAIHHVAVEIAPDPAVRGEVVVTATVRAIERTGMEMEAMVSAATAALTIYDMCKGVDRSISIREISLLFKEGGKSGAYRKGERKQ